MAENTDPVAELSAADWREIARLITVNIECGMFLKHVPDWQRRADYCEAQDRKLREGAAQKAALDARCAEIDAGARVRGVAALGERGT